MHGTIIDTDLPKFCKLFARLGIMTADELFVLNTAFPGRHLPVREWWYLKLTCVRREVVLLS
jgi:hypothetical protein